MTQFGDYTGVEKLNLASKDLVASNIQKLKTLFPAVITEGRDQDGHLQEAIDFDKLRDLLNHTIADGPETYEFKWVGKRGAIAEAGKPSLKTLRPDLEESVDFDKSENVFITGDNLEVLKVLQESYLGKIDMIYIDPPYNTGKDFVYSDKFQMSEEELADEMDLRDENGLQRVGLTKNEKSSARYHSDWLNMMYPRLVLARNLLKDSGVIFISIEDNEQANLKAICDEIFGEENFVNSISVKMSEPSGVKMAHVNQRLPKLKEHILLYKKNNIELNSVTLPLAKWNEEYKEFLENITLEEITTIKKFFDREYITTSDVEVVDSALSKVKIISVREAYSLHNNNNLDFETWRKANAWRIVQAVGSTSVKKLAINKVASKEQDVQAINSPKGKLYIYKTNFNRATKSPRIQILFADLNLEQKVGDFWADIKTTGGIGEEGGVLFPNAKKPIKLMERLLKLVTSRNNNNLILDFFAGSSSTAHATMELNAKDGGNRKFIMCTLDEKAEGDMEFETIDQLSRERIRRAAKKIQEEHPETVGKQDFGFRAYRLDSSNFKDVSQTPDSFSQESLFDSVSNIKDGRTDLDLLFQIMLTWGMELSLPIAKSQIDGIDIYNVADGALIACFADEISESVLRQIAKEEPLRAVFKDESFANSAAKINLSQIFKEEAPNTKVKVV
ncbi:site-specific DNA-methyltransferase [Streptococcus pluranimalium]